MTVNNIVVIDDDPISLEILCRAIEGVPTVSYLAFSDSFEAYQYFHHASAEDVDLVISDWKMPMLDGLELFNATKKMFPATSFLLVTAALSADASEMIKSLGMDGLISKPFSTSALTKKIQDLLDISQIV